LTPELRAEGDARELQRAVQDLRREAGLALDDRIALWLDPVPPAIEPHLASVAAETLASEVRRARPRDGVRQTTIELEAGPVTLGVGLAPLVEPGR
jgi:isoleucyl-tRNA synthetase